MDFKDVKNFFDRFLEEKKEFNRKACLNCFNFYDTDRDGCLNEEEFKRLLLDLFSDGGHSYTISKDLLNQFVELLDEDKDGKLSKKEFMEISFYWLKQVLQPMSALVIIDVQNDFLLGSLALRNCPAGQDGMGVVPAINSVLDTVNFDLVIYTRDWHPSDHISFIDNVNKRQMHTKSQVTQSTAQVYDTVIFDGNKPTEQKLWPTHCVQNSWGAEIHPHLKFVDGGIIVNKGTHSDVDSYSAFWDNNKQSQTELFGILSKNKVTDVYLCGVAYDICVGFTGLHSLEHGFRTVLIEDACRGVDLKDIENMRRDLKERGAVVVNSSKVKDLVEAQDRPIQMGYQTAKNVALARNLVKQGLNVDDV